ncbi:MAG: sensor histidine kinase [gamma proteobacterium symbiont of Taylorina sp.]|nr:sensor histidine kinase [gamma proteobacterium symbiont of Taylorina sp.]
MAGYLAYRMCFYYLPLLLFFSNTAVSAQTIEVEQQQVAMNDFTIAYLHDDENSLTIDDVISNISAFKNTSNNNSFGYQHKTTWYKITLISRSKMSRELYLHNNIAYMSKQIDIYEFNGKQQLDQNRYQFLDSSIGRKLSGSSLVYPVVLEPGIEKTIIFKNQALIHQLLNLSLYDKHNSTQALINKNFYANIIVIIICTLALYNVFLYFFSLRKEFIYYSFYLFNAALGLFYMYGSIFNHLNLYGELVYWFNLTALSVSFFLMLFVQSLFDTATSNKKLNRWLNFIIICSFLIALSALFLGINFAVMAANMIFVLSFFVLMALARYYYQQKNPLAGIFILAYAIYITGISIVLLLLIGLIPYNFFTFHASGLGIVMEALLFSYLLNFRVKLLEEEINKQKNTLIIKHKKSQMGDMIGAITHQWKQPLTAISSIVMLLQYRLQDETKIPSTELKHKFLQINEKIDFLIETINDFRYFFNPEKGGQEEYDVSKIVDKAVSLSHEELLSANIVIKTDCSFSHPVMVYQNELLHILLNIIQNAKEAFEHKRALETDHNGNETINMIKIVGQTIHNETIIDIIDNAGGISEDNLPHIFDEFYSTKDKMQGSGLGLHLSRFILETHMNGRIEASNIEHGVVFRIKLQ